MNIISVRENPNYKDVAINYFQQQWASDETLMLYQDAIEHSLNAVNPLPQWYLLQHQQQIIGCAGLITNDFISRMDLYPWFCSLYIDAKHRGHGYAALLLDKASLDAKAFGFNSLHLCTDRIGYYERYGFSYIGTGYHPWGESSRIYSLIL